MNKLLLVIGLLFSVALCAQNDFHKGYYINNEGTKTEGFLKLSSFKTYNENSFTHLDFKKELSTSTEQIQVSLINEFGFGTDIKYQKINVLLDDTNLLSEFGSDKNFSTKPTTLFLNVLVEGGLATLYSYDGQNGIKYFYKIAANKNKTQQLLYKKYYKSDKILTENNTYREQLFTDLKCPNQTFTDFLTIKYTKEDLIKLFSNYNSCMNSTSNIYENKSEKKFKIRFAALAGYTFINFQLKDLEFPVDKESFGAVQFGVEGEGVFPSEKFSVFGSVKYHSSKANFETFNTSSPNNPIIFRDLYAMDAKFIDAVLGARFYQKVGDFSKVYVGIGIGVNIANGSVIKSTINDRNPVEIPVSEANLGNTSYGTFQVGCLIKNHYAIEFSYDSTKDIIGTPNLPGSSTYNQYSILAKYIF